MALKDINWEELGKTTTKALFEILKENLEDVIDFSGVAAERLLLAAEQVSKYTLGTLQGEEDAEINLVNAEATLGWIAAKYEIEGVRGARAKARKVLIQAAKIALDVLRVLIKAL